MQRANYLLFGIATLLTACSTAPKIKEAVPVQNKILPVAHAPKLIQHASDSVLLLIFADRPKVTNLSTEKKMSDFFNPQIPFSNLEKYIVASQIEVCKKNKKMTHCPVSREMLTATAFLMKDRKHLYTNYHPFFEYIKKIIKIDTNKDSPKVTANKIALARLPIFLVNSKGQFLISPHLNTVTISNLSLMNLFPKNESALLSDYDFVELELDSDLSDILPLEIAQADESEIVYLLGYPTENPNESTDGSHLSLHFSTGKYLPYDQAAEKLKLSPVSLLSKQLADLANNATFYYEGKSVPGMSGGSYLNRFGKVVGIHRGTRESAENLELSIGIKSQFMMSFPFSIKSYK